MKNLRAIIISIALIVLGVGIMGMSSYIGQMKSIGGGIFLIGVALTAIFLYHELKK